VSTPSGIVVAGGLVKGDRSTAHSYRIRLADGHITHLSDLAVAVHDAAGGSLNGTPIVIGGGNSTEQTAVQALRPGGHWRVVAQLPQPRADLATVATAQRLLVIGGYDGVRAAGGVLTDRRSGRFRPHGRLTIPVRYPSVVVLGGDVWVLGGERNGRMVSAVQRIDVRTGRCRVVARLPRGVGHAAAAVVRGQVLLMGGRTNSDTVTSRMELFDPRHGSTRFAGRLPEPLADAGVVARHTGVYLLGGETPRLTARVVRVKAQ
jgi:N-acetylneuraminic acid mutarotase